ncbi:hypothetical protein EVAR_26493_1 [Eumeta japonica]|uniref:Uncharacterized protein n=1 Tax=Eumeta variegata TaxID=151549 RepID=A0A4C1V7U6_EUMVA|nr:hypothetical protein EVAR_26493_1 [Eumeta japonica]
MGPGTCRCPVIFYAETSIDTNAPSKPLVSSGSFDEDVIAFQLTALPTSHFVRETFLVGFNPKLHAPMRAGLEFRKTLKFSYPYYFANLRLRRNRHFCRVFHSEKILTLGEMIDTMQRR